ncbi:bifunctional [glutamine synthetase] adenylyltransferase/[glutamine synthetase]-adenylyl-L-tyrosine phosphorylase [Microbacterium sp. zg.Y1090]|uniref:bifunctional [glutamine synthetase] adenylyltransferase/[glutamine synthetase]-adenylyl-L-tyrosine phosphorylase n=1 Tax=Microbacterium TaxID=33882 RepID=UPI00214D030A|nr:MULTISPECIES: bifunctional [glutamine synthetase] adenylyltransferase/[glutamine synthetase]-adenylyl-L-tyrosine phosphorylase [unclassified Microbacterium]MCR2811814.1 bifunctional [glutamine synthetase] adenylyltransferase/[glutamine synthetase]-adenylyl-L-tyrosine phosphorylase [Microbacterium sp. zg.Y1084]MCR2818748.1 bifunctional [glutamine synthetase] adenylyltransferase/[glutamine synthetase]-adenylyl-L-tyrosine phosphorylase [Microbacterium sp. zg.Y1090]MDL5486838.1 bifunctional [glut
MSTSERSSALTALARLGFTGLAEADRLAAELVETLGIPRETLIADAAVAADPNGALEAFARIARRDPEPVRALFSPGGAGRSAWALLGASRGFGEFYLRHPQELAHLPSEPGTLPTAAELTQSLLQSVGAADGFAAGGDDADWVALRVRYRRMLARIAVFDLRSPSPDDALAPVAAALADAAGAALEASLSVARARVSGPTGPGLFSREHVAGTRLAIIGMGKAGARELNYVSDVDVIFVGGGAPDVLEELGENRIIDIATRLAVLTMRGISSVEIEPPLWEVDANLRPEGKQGALVRSLDSHLAYYDRWAKSWEFQALLKARPLAGDAELGDRYVAAVQPKVWTSAARENFVDSVQRMRERVTEHIPGDEVAYQLKLGPGGIRDIEFTVQLLQLVHGLADEAVRQRGTLDALDALVAEGYIARADAAVFARDYRVLRVLEHRLQLRGLSRTHLMPRTPEGLRELARASRLADSGDAVWRLWESVKREVREIHVRLFYKPLLSAVAALPPEEQTLSPAQAHDRLAAIGFQDPAGALRHIGALTSGISRKAAIQRHLMPIMLRWFADGVDPDYGLLAFRRISERLGDTPWFLRMLRDSSGAAERLTHVLSGSRYVGELMEWIPESVAWLDSGEQLRPRAGVVLEEEARAIQSRHRTIDDAMRAVRALRRRELLRLAMASMLEDLTIEDIAHALTTVTEVTIQATLRAVRREVVPAEDDALDFSVIAMGRFGGAELGFGSDADVLYVYRPNGVDPQRAHALALQLVAGLRTYSEDSRVPLDLDADLRPEGRNGPLVRSLEAYAEYYRRWSVAWEAQALLRARGVAGSVKLIRAFTEMADAVRYPATADPQGVREIKRIKARVENERLPQGTDRSRHLKLGPGSLSDVEWLVQLLQLQHGHRIEGLRTTSTMDALRAAVEAGLVGETAAQRLAEAWRLASRLRSANTLLSGQTSDILPTDRRRLDGIGRLLEYPPRSATQVEEDYLGATRRARRVFEKLFYG